MSVDFRWLKQLWEGRRLLGQTAEFGAALPASGTLFTIAGGRILITSIIGEITASCDANATAIRLQADPTTGTTVNLCTATDIASYIAGDILGITGIPTDPMLPATTSGAIPAQTMGVVCNIGTITMVLGAAGQVTGRVRWTLHWIPLDSGSAVS